jgi:hypothetical protein
LIAPFQSNLQIFLCCKRFGFWYLSCSWSLVLLLKAHSQYNFNNIKTYVTFIWINQNFSKNFSVNQKIQRKILLAQISASEAWILVKTYCQWAWSDFYFQRISEFQIVFEWIIQLVMSKKFVCQQRSSGNLLVIFWQFKKKLISFRYQQRGFSCNVWKISCFFSKYFVSIF